jgi:nucleotidyltransferase/DNA polymerase involved in DNA repair
MYMIGTATAKYLKANGINTIGDLANARHNKLASILNKN